MLVGVLVGLAIMVGCFLVPIAHFILGPAGPFFAGYWGIQFARNPGRLYALHGLIFCSLLALIMGVILVGVSFLLIALFDDPRVKVLVWLGVIVLTLYTGSMGTMGAMSSSLREQQRAQRQAEENERES